MKFIDQSVRVFYPRSLEDGIAELKDIETAGRNCWRSEGRISDESYKPFITGLLRRGHVSPVEFAFIKLAITTSRDVMAELTRHRLASFCIESQRYVNESKEDGGISFIKPQFYLPFDPNHVYKQKDPAYEASRKWEDAMELAEDAYNQMIEMGMRNEDARKVLPNSTACVIMMACNLRELRHIYSLRSSPAAYPEMRQLIRLAKTEIDKVYPGFLPEKE